jgi:hypothetical protein
MDLLDLMDLPAGPDPEVCRKAIEAHRKRELQDHLRHIAMDIYKHTKNADIWRAEVSSSYAGTG